MDPDGVEAYLTRLLPHAAVVTPNLREAGALTATAVGELMSVAAMSEAAERIRSGGARYVVVKGGHLTDVAHDVVAGPDGITVLEGARVPTSNDHGTGCSLSASIAAQLALGADVPEAISAAKAFVAARAGRGGFLAARAGAWARSTISGGHRRRRLERS